MKAKTLIKFLFNPRLGWDRMGDKITILLRTNRVFAKKKVLSKIDKHPVIYIRTPKTASSSIVLALEESGRIVNMLDKKIKKKDFLLNIDLSNKIICVGSNKDRDWFIEKYPEIWANAFKWAVVRNPYDKAISAWKYLESTSDKKLSEVLVSPPNKDDNFLDYHHFTRTQTEALSEKGEIYVDFILRYENLSSEWIRLEHELGIKLPKLPVVNKTSNRSRTDSKDSLSHDEKEIIYNRFHTDFKNFGYSK